MKISGTLGFLGYGNMGGAILDGLLHAGTVEASQVLVYDPDEARSELARERGATLLSAPELLAAQSDTLVLAVKPQVMGEALHAIQPGFVETAVVISIAAGITIDFIQKRLGAAARVVRAMPNTPALVHCGMTGLAASPNATGDDLRTARILFEAVGKVEIVTEPELDAVTAVSGSGPAYVFYLVECMVAAGMAEGLEREVALRLTIQTLGGAARLLSDSGESPETLRGRVTSKGGTTAAAIAVYESNGLHRILQEGISAAARRACELAEELDE